VLVTVGVVIPAVPNTLRMLSISPAVWEEVAVELYKLMSVPTGNVIRILALEPRSLIALKSPLAASSIANALALG